MEDWINVFVLHQNRVQHGASSKNCLQVGARAKQAGRAACGQVAGHGAKVGASIVRSWPCPPGGVCSNAQPFAAWRALQMC